MERDKVYDSVFLDFEKRFNKLENKNDSDFKIIDLYKYDLYDIKNMIEALDNKLSFHKIDEEIKNNLDTTEYLITDINDESDHKKIDNGSKTPTIEKANKKKEILNKTTHFEKKETLNKFVASNGSAKTQVEKKEIVQPKSANVEKRRHYRTQSSIIDKSTLSKLESHKANTRRQSVKIEERKEEDESDEEKDPKKISIFQANSKKNVISDNKTNNRKIIYPLKKMNTTNISSSNNTIKDKKKEDSKEDNDDDIDLKVQEIKKVELEMKINKVLILTKPKKHFSSKYMEALYLLSISKFIPESLKKNMILSIKEIYENTNLSQLKADKLKIIKDKITLLENNYKCYFNEIGIEELINKQFNPSRTALNGLNFINKEEEKILLIKDSRDIDNVFKLIYIIIKEEIPDENIIPNLINNVIPKMELKNLKQLLTNIIPKTIIDDQIYNKLVELDTNKILNSSDLLRLSKTVSYMSFMLREICDYILLKSNSGIPIYKIRKIRDELENIKKYFETFIK